MHAASTKVLVSAKNLIQSKAFIALLAVFVASIFIGQNASASMNTNSRLQYGNAYNYCHTDDNGPGFYAKGMVWLSNDEGDYYSEQVGIPTDATKALVSIRGAVNTCGTPFSADTEMWAINVSTSYLSGVSGTSFWRGNVPGGTLNAWSSQGSKLYGNLDVSSIALCDANSLTTGSAKQTISIGITRQMVQQRSGYYWESPVAETEWVPINVTRTCPKYKYSLTPSITNLTPGLNGQITTSGSGARNINGSVTNNGPTISKPDANWQLTELIYRPGASIPSRSAGSSTQSPCQYFKATSNYSCIESGPGSTVTGGVESSGYAYPNSNSYTRSSTIGTEDVGTRICYAMSVQPRADDSTNWEHSGLYCYLIAKKPKVQIYGSDLRAIGAGKGNVTTSTGRFNGSSYGSWSEYGIFASGKVDAMASGSGYAGGVSSTNLCTSLSLLTFANATNPASPTCDATKIGGYKGPSTSSVDALISRFVVTSGAPNITGTKDIQTLASNTVYPGSGTISLTSTGTVPKGKWVVINAPSATVRITQDIRYDTGVFSSPADIPQLVIIARNIIITDNVTNVDAWLVTKSTTATDGIVNTCDAPGITEPVKLTAGVCNAKLTVNGPVYASHLLLYRTGGTGNTAATAGDPAEVFNLRPDAYMWASALPGGNVARTVMTTELPPRF